ncbi:MAG: hypothetical protein K0R78_2238 [Pelosinus sp.]|jgi:probable selenium-dependent hydroxylase accessory protein YqeC|nr:hypothetical protein [Pelosinus sp.]
MELWKAIGIKEPCIIACTGAGGKTSVILSLARTAQSINVPVLLSSTTKMYYSQVVNFNPIFSNDFVEGSACVALHLAHKRITSWFSGVEEDKVIGLPLEWLDRMIQNPKINPYILVEADGARGLWLKSSGSNEPIVPFCTKITVGVLNLQAIGQPLTNQIAHRLELVLELLKKQEREIVDWRDLAILALHKQGIFQHSKGTRILILNGATVGQVKNAKRITEYLRKTKSEIYRCVLTEGYGEALRAIEVYDL